MKFLIKKLFSIDTHSHPIDRLADVNSIVSGIALYPQLFKIIFDDSIIGLSYVTFLIIAINSLVWIAYGYHRRSMPLLISSLLNLISSTGILLYILINIY